MGRRFAILPSLREHCTRRVVAAVRLSDCLLEQNRDFWPRSPRRCGGSGWGSMDARQGHQSAVSPVLSILSTAAAVAAGQRCSAGRFATQRLRRCLTRIAYGAAPRPAAIAAAAVDKIDKTGAPRPTGIPASPQLRLRFGCFQSGALRAPPPP